MIRIAHVINPVNAPEDSELASVQPITFESMKVGKAFSDAKVHVELFCVSYQEDREIIPSFFTPLKDLERSVLDLGSFGKKRKLPLIKDILQRVYDGTESEWLIYTNADIGLMPQFYSAVAQMIAEGNDALLVTRRRISKKYRSVEQLPEMYSEIGGYHPGYDCFVFHRSLLDKFVLDNICIGVPFIEVSLLHNFIAFAKKLKVVDDQHLTFHIGMEVMPPVDQEYYRYNRNIYEKNILPKIKPLLDIDKFPFSALPFHRRILKWGLNPCFSTALVLELEGKSFRRKMKMMVDEWRWKILSK